MRYSSDHRSETRRRILTAATRAFSRDGIGAAGVASIMAEIGLSAAALYPHFRSKEALVEEVVVEAIDAMARLATKEAREAERRGQSPIVGIVDAYLSERHLRSSGTRCVVATLGPELSRQARPVRQAATVSIDKFVGAIAAELTPPDDVERARSLLCLMAGAMQQAMTAPRRKDALSILSTARAACLRLLD